MSLTEGEEALVRAARAAGRHLTVVDDNEARVLALGRKIKRGSGHGHLGVEYRAGVEHLFEPVERELPPRRVVRAP